MSRRSTFVLVASVIGVLWLGIGFAFIARGNLNVPFLGGYDTTPDCEGPKAGAQAGNMKGTVPAWPDKGGDGILALGDPSDSGLPRWPGPFDAKPTTYDFDGDGVQEIIAQSNDTLVYVFNAQGRVLAALKTTYPPGWHIERVLNSVEVAILDPGQPASIIVTDHAACVAAWQFDPTKSDRTHFTFRKMWEVRMSDCFWNPGMDAKPTVADMDGDGRMEILLQTEEQGFFALASNGTTLWHECWAGGNADPVAADLDGDKRLEAIFASDSGFVSVHDGITGQTLWTFDAADASHGIVPASITASPTVAELDGAWPRELVFTVRQAQSADPDTFADNHMAIFAVRQERSTWQTQLVWMRQPDWAHPLSQAHIVARDLDGDGRTELFGMDWNTIGHNPGNWENLGPAHVFSLGPDGKDRWVRTVDSWWSNKDVVYGDFDRDGEPDLLANAARDGLDGFWQLDADTGEPERFLAVPGWKVMRAPVIADLYGDGGMQALVAVEPDVATPRIGAILVIPLARGTSS